MAGRRHQQTPDTDNLTKALKDALADQDCRTWDEWSTKVWWYHPGLFVADMDHDTIPTSEPLPVDQLIAMVHDRNRNHCGSAS